MSDQRKGGSGFGIPTATDYEIKDSSQIKVTSQAQVLSQDSGDIRKGGSGFGIPKASGDTNVALAGADNKPVAAGVPEPKYSFLDKQRAKKAAAIEKEFEELTTQSTILTRLQKIYLSGLVVLAAFLGFFTITQTTNFIVQLKDSPSFVKYPLYVAVGAFASVIFYFIFRLLLSWFMLKRSPQVSLGMLTTLSKRRDLQEKCYQKSDEACNDLYAIINSVKEEEYKKTLKAMQVTEEEVSELFASRQELCKRHEARLVGKARESSREWLEAFTDDYQTKLDHYAEERIKYYSYRGGIAATISHLPALDRFIVLSAMFGLVKDLLAIYNIRPSRLNTSILLSKVIVNTFCSGYVQEGAEAFGEGINKALEAFKVTFSSLPIVKELTSRSVEATAHGFLIYRVGGAAQKMLVPVVRK